MKALVIKAYTDRLDGKVHFSGETVELTDARAAELSKGGYVEVQETKAAPKKAAPRKRTTKKVD